MRLKKLEINGFKSFANKVTLELPDGITAIVGPNGSGKSNVSEAVMWVLGEQSAKSLRGGKMEDIIFAGTSTKKAMGMAEVSITIDNKDKKMPIEFAEVTVTRKLYRSGESQFLINKVPCRLKDIHGLFMDTGLGRDGYSIIGQGKVNEIIQAKPEARRNVFEEAAGIIKYKTRKEETKQKIEATEANLVRVNDIIVQLEEQLAPLEKQSKEAEEYLKLKEELKSIEIGLYIDEVDRLNKNLENSNAKKNEMENLININQTKIQEINAKKEEILELIDNLSKVIEEKHGKEYEISTEIQRVEGEKNLQKEKISNLDSIIEKDKKYIEESKNDIEVLKQKDDELKNALNELKELINSKVEELSQGEKDIKDSNFNLQAEEQDIEKSKGEVINLLNQISVKNTSINTLKGLKENINSALKKLYIQKEELTKGATEANTEIKEFLTKRDETIKHIADCEEIIKQCQCMREKFLKDFDMKREEFDKTTIKIQQLNSKVDMLSEMERQFEGYAKSVKAILKECEKNPSMKKGVCGALAQLIKVDKKYETAIEISLAGNLQNIVTETEDDAKKLIFYLKSNNIGRATFFPVSTIKPRDFDKDNYKSIAKCNGFVGVASELVNFDSKYKNIISNLLGRVVIVDNIDNATKMANKNKHSFKIVTLDGDVINPGGSMTGGSNQQKSYAFLSRAREIDELKNELELKNKEKENLEISLKNIKSKAHELEETIKINNMAMQDYKIDLVQSENYIKQKENEICNIEKRIKIIKNEEETIDNQVKTSDETIAKEEGELEKLKSQKELLEELIKKKIESLQEFKQKHDDELQKLNKIKVDISENKQKLIAAKEKSNDNLNRMADIERNLEVKNQEIANNINNKNILNDKLVDLDSKLKLFTNEKLEVSKEIEKFNTDLKVKKGTLSDLDREVNSKTQETQSLKDSFYKLDNNIIKYQTELESAHTNVWEKYSITYSNAEAYRIQSEKKDIKERLKELRNSLKGYQNVNIGAIEEYKRVEEKHSFLSGQKSDLEESIKSLNDVMNDVTECMREQFKQKFEIIREGFKRVFVDLFGGGRADLVLTNEEDVLDSGVEIIAEPPGKKLQSITLLSGGEKALTAISLLFAIFEVKPAPFCILDEIEAALDDANVYRYAQYLNKLSTDTQFLVITHRKGTMESAHNLYGISMEEKGISKIVSLKLED